VYFTSGVYQKLGNTLNHLLKECPFVDGIDASCLCDFFLKTLYIFKISQIAEPTVYELLYPYCRGEIGHVLIRLSLRVRNLMFIVGFGVNSYRMDN
jgi:hypothetical protein